MSSLNAQTPNLGKGVSCVHYQPLWTAPDKKSEHLNYFMFKLYNILLRKTPSFLVKLGNQIALPNTWVNAVSLMSIFSE